MKTLMVAIAAAFFSLSAAAYNPGEGPDDYCVMNRNGRTVIEHNGKTITRDVRFKNGSVIKPDGTVILASGKRVKLQEGECVDENSVLNLSKHRNETDKKEYEKSKDPVLKEGEETWDNDPYNRNQMEPDKENQNDKGKDSDEEPPKK